MGMQFYLPEIAMSAQPLAEYLPSATLLRKAADVPLKSGTAFYLIDKLHSSDHFLFCIPEWCSQPKLRTPFGRTTEEQKIPQGGTHVTQSNYRVALHVPQCDYFYNFHI
jgi:hypothetical protein